MFLPHRLTGLSKGVRFWHRPASDASPHDWQQLASRAAVSTFAIAGLAARPSLMFFVSVTADEVRHDRSEC